MNAFYRATEYLQEKIKKTNINNPKANAGCCILKGYSVIVPDIEELVLIAKSVIDPLFVKESEDSIKGQATLTYTSHSIGVKVARELKLSLTWTELVRLGDLFIESFYNIGLVRLTYQKRMDSCHVLNITQLWVDSSSALEYRPQINGSSTLPPEPISKMMQTWQWKDNKERSTPVIKDKTASDSYIIRRSSNAPWLKSIDKLQSMAWKIDNRLLEAVEREVIPKPETDDEQLLQRYESKRLEKDNIEKRARELSTAPSFYQYIDADYRGRFYYVENFMNFQGSDWARGIMKFAEGKPLTADGEYWLAVHTANSYNMSFHKDKIPEFFQADYKSYLEDEGLESISVDKMTLDDRVAWTNHMMKEIYRYADEMVVDDTAEKPISFLACCLEWRDYADQGDSFRSHLPVPVDGSNNGWQHLGAISKDVQTAKLVGLSPVEIQADFYVKTAKELHRLTTDERRLSLLNEMPMKDIRKGISKRGSMTRAYSAGAVKIAENMWLDCRSEGFDEKYGITDTDCLGFANDLIKAIDNVCPGPLSTMKYLQDLAQFEIGVRKRFKDGELAEDEFQAIRREMGELYSEYNEKKNQFKKKSPELDDWVANNADWKEMLDEKKRRLTEQLAEFQTVVVEGNGHAELTWVTPAGFPVEYTAFKMVPRVCKGTISGYTTHNKRGIINHVGQEATDTPDINKFVCGVAPNFIHSLDASHMALVISSWSGYFGAVHDSFSTHACDVEDLVRATKREFVKMYDVDNYYDRIRYQLTCDTDTVEQPELGELAIQEVYDSDYFFA